jgi:hypothetical protein
MTVRLQQLGLINLAEGNSMIVSVHIKFLIIIAIHLLLLDMSHLSINRIAGRLNLSDCPPYIPLFGESASFVHHRRSLPIFKYRQEILNQLECQQVVVIAGDVGCGKTTQVPQYILENAYERKAACRIISIQPRRISVHAALDRVVAERGKFLIELKKRTFFLNFHSKNRCDWRKISRTSNSA